jgi:hypothetical protein
MKPRKKREGKRKKSIRNPSVKEYQIISFGEECFGGCGAMTLQGFIMLDLQVKLLKSLAQIS